MNRKKYNQGQVLVPILVFGAIAVYLIAALANWSATSIKASNQTFNRETAFQIAEAGTDYYRWHLAHAPTDYQDGTAASGPYVHDFADKDGNAIGQFSLDITPPPVGSTLVQVESTGEVTADANIARKITTRLAKPSFAKYAVISNVDLSIGAEIYGPMHSNGGIHYISGHAYNLITSAVSTFNSAVTGFVTKWGVYADGDPNPPTPFTPVTSTFTVGRQVGVPTLDFAGITIDLTTLEQEAIAGGKHYNVSGGLGYHIVLKTTDNFDIYRVDTSATGGSNCETRQWWTYPNCPLVSNAKWSIGSQTLVASNVPFPANGIIFAQDNIWVDGQIDGARLTIAAANIPDVGTRRNIIVNHDLLYTHYDGQDVIGLIAQDNFWVGVVSDDDLRIDAAIIAQNGRVSRYAYRNCGSSGSYDVQSNITFYGMFASNQRYAFGNLGGSCDIDPDHNGTQNFTSGYQTSRTYIYDPYLLYGPPPSFPLTADRYVNLSWEE